MKHVQSGQCMMVDETKGAGKFLVGKKDKQTVLKKDKKVMFLFIAPCEEENQGKQRWYLERALLI